MQNVRSVLSESYALTRNEVGNPESKVVVFTLLGSRQVDEQGAVVVVTLHVFVSNEHLDLLLDHLGVGTEHRDIANDIRHQVLESIRLLCLHDLHCVSLDNKGTLSCNLLGLCALFRRRLGVLFLDHLLRDQIAADGVRRELGVNFDFLVLTKHRLVDFLQQDLDLGVTEAHHSSSELFLAEAGPLADLRASHFLILIEKAKDGGLKHIHYELILLCSVLHL